MGHSHTRGRVKVSESLRNERLWHSDSYSIWGNAKFASSMYKHTPMPPFCYRAVYIYIYIYIYIIYIYASRLMKPAAFSRTAERFSTSYIHSTRN